MTGQQPSQAPSGFRFDSQTVRGVSFKLPLGDEENMFKSCDLCIPLDLKASEKQVDHSNL